MTVARRLAIALGLHMLLLGALVFYHLQTIRHSVTTAQALSEVSAHLVLSSARQSARLSELDEAAAKFAVTRDRGYLGHFDRIRTEFTAELGQWATLPVTMQEARAVETAQRTWSPMRAAAANLGSWSRPGANAADSLEALRLQLDAMRASTDAVSDAAQQTMYARLEQSVADADRAERVSYLAAVVALLLAVLTAVLLTRSITEPLRRLTAGTREVARGRFGYRLDTRRGDEFAQVAQAFNTMTERLGAIDRMKQDFVSSVSHDLKSPLASLRETTTLLLDGPPGPLTPSQRRLLQLQRESAERLGSMIAKLLDLSRLESGLPLSIRQEALTPLLEASVEHAAAAAVERDVRITLGGAHEGVRIACDADRIRQLLDNLLDNAAKFSPRGALVDLSVRVVGDRLELAVADRGAGIAPDDRERVFERFYQTTEGRAVPGRGVGLGLTICREIVQAHGGNIRVEDNEGGGTIFRVSLPGVELLGEDDEPVTVGAGTGREDAA